MTSASEKSNIGSLVMVATIAVCAALVLQACPASPDKPTPAGSDADKEVQPPVVTRDSPKLLFSFLDQQGRIQATSQIDDVPENVRERVLVVDLAKSPEERQAHRYAFFANLQTPDKDGRFEVSVVSRYQAAKSKGAAPTLLPNIPDGTVILYSAVWCGYCKKAKKWLTQKNVPFVVRDVEKTPGAAAELQEKLRENSMQGGGVPVIDWNGTLVMGFDQKKLGGLLASSSAITKDAPDAPQKLGAP